MLRGSAFLLPKRGAKESRAPLGVVVMQKLALDRLLEKTVADAIGVIGLCPGLV